MPSLFLHVLLLGRQLVVCVCMRAHMFLMLRRERPGECAGREQMERRRWAWDERRKEEDKHCWLFYIHISRRTQSSIIHHIHGTTGGWIEEDETEAEDAMRLVGGAWESLIILFNLHCLCYWWRKKRDMERRGVHRPSLQKGVDGHSLAIKGALTSIWWRADRSYAQTTPHNPPLRESSTLP